MTYSFFIIIGNFTTNLAESYCICTLELNLMGKTDKSITERVMAREMCRYCIKDE